MPANQDRRNQKTVWDILPILAMIGSIITAWVNLNGKLTQVEIQQKYNEKINVIRYTATQKSLTTLKADTQTLAKRNRNVIERIGDVERIVNHRYSKKTNR